MIEASQILDLSLGFVALWLLVALAHGLVAARSPAGDPLPAEPEPPHHDH